MKIVWQCSGTGVCHRYPELPNAVGVWSHNCLDFGIGTLFNACKPSG